MESKKAFTVLGIAETKDEDAIRNAYRQKLHLVNPEDDPKGFKQLREAYEAALTLCRKNEEQESGVDDTPSGLFVHKADEIYQSIEDRRDERKWRSLFEEDAFIDLEEEEACREKLIAWLMNHFYLPTEIWKLLDDKMHIVQEKDKLYEKFSRDFVDYMIRKIRHGEDFEFEQLEGPFGADLDSWIFLIVKAGREESEKNYEAMEETIRQAEEMEITHPSLSFMKARLLLAKGNPEEGAKIVEKQLAGPYSHRLNVRYQSAEYYFSAQKKERAKELYLNIKEENARHYMANRRLAQLYLEEGLFVEAKECVNILLSYPLDDEGREMVDKVNAGLSDFLKNRLEKDPADLKARMDLAWCYLQGEETQKAIELMQKVTPPAGQEKDYCNLMGKVFYYAGEYEKAVPLINRWAELLNEQMPEEKDKKEADKERVATAHSMLAQILLNRAKEETGEDRDNVFLKVMAHLDAAKEAHYNAGQDFNRAQAYLEWEKYETCIEICTELTEQYPDFAAAVMLRQRAYAKRFNGAGVVEDYFTLRRLEPSYAKSWELAAEVYYQLKRWDDLENLLSDAKKENVDTAQLGRYRFFWLANNAEKKNELLEALEYARKVSEDGEKEGWTNEEKADFLAERARNYWRINGHETALQLIEQAILLNAQNLMYTYIKAGIKKDQQCFKEALSLYLSCEKDYDQTAHYYANIGECYYKMELEKEALLHLKKAVAIDPKNPVSSIWIERILKEQMEREQNLDQMEEALQYAGVAVEHRGISFDYIERGLLYALAQDYETAARDFEKAVEVDGKDPFAYSNLARMYRLLNRLPEAKETAKQALAVMDQDPAPYHYEVLGDICWQMEDYDGAFQAFMERYKRFPKGTELCVKKIANILCDAGKWQQAAEFLQRHYHEKGEEYVRKCVGVYCSAGFFDQAAVFLKNYRADAGISGKEYEKMLADIYWYQGELKKAAEHIKLAVKVSPESIFWQPSEHARKEAAARLIQNDESEMYPEACYTAAKIYFFLGDKTMAALWAQAGLDYYERNGGFVKWLNPLEDRLMRMHKLGTLQLCAGNLSAAKAIVAEMKTLPKCAYCHQCRCMDAEELRADILFSEGRIEEAISVYESVLEGIGTDKDVRMKLSLLKRRKGTI